MIFIKIIIDIVCGVLNALGGWHILWLRREGIPLLLGISCAIITHTWWVFFLPLPAIGTLSLGYSKDGNFGRALWIGLQCFALGLGFLLFHHLLWYVYLPYIVGGCVLGGLYRNWQQILGDAVTGTYMGLLILLVR